MNNDFVMRTHKSMRSPKNIVVILKCITLCNNNLLSVYYIVALFCTIMKSKASTFFFVYSKELV